MNIEEKLEQIDRLAGMASAVLARQNEQARGDYLNIRQELESFMMQHKKKWADLSKKPLKADWIQCWTVTLPKWRKCGKKWPNRPKHSIPTCTKSIKPTGA